MLQLHCHVVASTLYLHVDPHVVDNCVPITAAYHVCATCQPRCRLVVVPLQLRWRHVVPRYASRCRHARATLCLTGATLLSVCSLVVSRSDKTQSARLAKLSDVPVTLSSFDRHVQPCCEMWHNVEQRGYNETKRDKT
jgi:hypothetical protein